MFRVLFLFFALFILIPSVTIFSQDDVDFEHEALDDDFEQLESEEEEIEVKRPREDFWFSVGGDTALYGLYGFTYGGSFSIGYGTGSSVGLRVTYFYDKDNASILELNFLLRFYLLRPNISKPSRTGYQGPFIQLIGGPVIFNGIGNFSIPSTAGLISAGINFGWRFVFADRFFIEPSIRGGYPYLFGATAALGFRF